MIRSGSFREIEMSENFFAATLGLLFLAVMAGVEALLLWWRPRFGGEARRLARRLALIGPQQAAERSVLKPRGELGGAGWFNCIG